MLLLSHGSRITDHLKSIFLWPLVLKMGCCYSICFDPGVPDNDVWRHMPAPDSAEDYVIQSCGMFSKDYNVYHGREVSEEKRQLWMNKEGSWTTGQASIDIENFHLKTDGEPNNPKDEKRGQVLWHAEFRDRPHFDQHVCWSQGRHERFLGFFDGYDSDDDDTYYNRIPQHSGKFFNKFIVKFSCRTSARIRPGKTGKGVNFRPGLDLTLKVFCKGTAVRVTTRTWTARRDEEGNVIGHYWVYNNHDSEFIDWIEYKLVHNDIAIAIFRCEGMGNSSSWECPIFRATKDGGFFSDGDCKVETKEGWDPLLGLMLAHLCSTEYSPNQLKADFVPQFPHHTHYRYGRGNRPRGNLWYAPESDDRDPEMINGGIYDGGIAIEPEMFQAIPGYEREFYIMPPEADLDAEAEAEEDKPKVEIDFGDLATMPPTPGPVLRVVPAHMETDPETGLLVFKPISFETLTPPDSVEKVEEDVEVCISESDDEDSDGP